MPSYVIFFEEYGDHRDLHSFPTRRSSDLVCRAPVEPPGPRGPAAHRRVVAPVRAARATGRPGADRKSTRLNSSHVEISYAVFCLKKKKIVHPHTQYQRYRSFHLCHIATVI